MKAKLFLIGSLLAVGINLNAQKKTTSSAKPAAKSTTTTTKKTVKKTSQEDDFVKGSKVLNLGIGLGNITYGSHYSSQIPPVSASLEFGVADKLFKNSKGAIGVAPVAGFGTYKYKYADGDKATLTNIELGVRGNLHYQFIPKLDTYTGLELGYYIVSWNDSKFNSAAGSGIAFSWLIGGRYYFSDNVAAMLELGYSLTAVNLGVALKLK